MGPIVRSISVVIRLIVVLALIVSWGCDSGNDDGGEGEECRFDSSYDPVTSPSNGEIVSDSTPTIQWGWPGDIPEYRFMLDDSISFTDPLVDHVTGDYKYNLSEYEALKPGVYYWRVQCTYGNDWGEWSDAHSFSVQSVIVPDDVYVDGIVASSCDDSPIQGASVEIEASMNDTTDSLGHYQILTESERMVDILVTHQNHHDFNGVFYLYSTDKTFNVELIENEPPITQAFPSSESQVLVGNAVTLTASDNCDSDPIIFFTTDGSSPTTNSNLYTTPILILDDTTLKFISVDESGNEEPVNTATYTMTRIINSFPSPGGKGLAFDGTYLWVGGGGELYKINPSDGSVVDIIDPDYSFGFGLTFDGTSIWTSSNVMEELVKINPSDGSTINIFSSPNIKPMGLGFDGTYLWSVHLQVNLIYKLDSSNGSIVDSVRDPTVWGASGIACDGLYFWCCEYDKNVIYKVASWDGSVVYSFIPFPTIEYPSLMELAFDGTYLWVLEGETDTIYQLTIDDLE